MNKRLAMLEQLAESGAADSFAWYALGMEYRKERLFDEALRTFETLRSRDPAYLPVYLMAGQMLLELGRAADARTWFVEGIPLARRQGNAKALGELEQALAETEES